MYMRIDGAYSESLGGSIRMPKTENWFRVGSPKVVAVYRWRIEGEVTSLTTLVWLKLYVSLSRDSRESLA